MKNSRTLIGNNERNRNEKKNEGSQSRTRAFVKHPLDGKLSQKCECECQLPFIIITQQHHSLYRKLVPMTFIISSARPPPRATHVNGSSVTTTGKPVSSI